MPAFTAIINTDGSPLDQSLLGGLLSATTVGPVETRVRIDGCVGLATVADTHEDDRRLGSEPGRIWAVMDGRLDDRAGLEAALGTGDDSAATATASDVALLARAYEKWGDDCVSHLIGDFSFCLWDATNRR